MSPGVAAFRSMPVDTQLYRRPQTNFNNRLRRNFAFSLSDRGTHEGVGESNRAIRASSADYHTRLSHPPDNVGQRGETFVMALERIGGQR